MDGAIILSDDVDTILKANVHLNPSSSIETIQTGTRHRTAERVAKETGLMEITVSEESSVINIFWTYNFILFFLSELNKSIGWFVGIYKSAL